MVEMEERLLIQLVNSYWNLKEIIIKKKDCFPILSKTLSVILLQQKT